MHTFLITKYAMLNLNTYPSDCFSPTYRRIVSALSTEKKDATANDLMPLLILEGTEKLIKEELVRCIWFGQHFKKDTLYTDDGLRLEVLTPGWETPEGGPDFKHAEILLEGKGLVKGNVEIHVFASDWARHQHQKQETYNTVCLHVVMWNDREETHIKNMAGQMIPQLTLSKYLDTEIDDIVNTIDVEAYLKGKKVNPGHCKTEMKNQSVDRHWLGQFLDYAGDDRVIQKAGKYERWLEQRPFEQALYEAIMESLGYKNNKEPFLTLASRVPLKEMRLVIPEDAPPREKAVHIQALLLGAAGLLPRLNDARKVYDDETVAYIKTIGELWNSIQQKTGIAAMARSDWRYAGMRPANYPERRIAAISNILPECMPQGIFQRILAIFQKPAVAGCQKVEDAAIIKTVTHDVQTLFLNTQDPYWSYRYVAGGKKFSKPQKLLGQERVSAIFINVVIPILLVYARKHHDINLEKTLHLIYRNYTPLPETSVTKFMNNRIWGEPWTPKKMVRSVRRQQGLYQLFKDFCENDNLSCNKCALYLAVVNK